MSTTIHVRNLDDYQFATQSLADVEMKTFIVGPTSIEMQLETTTGTVFFLVSSLVDGNRHDAADHII